MVMLRESMGLLQDKGRLVKKGDHVSLVIGKLHADGLVVD
jgi:hypothetical protein